MVSAMTNANLPSMFGRRPLAERDFRRAVAHPAFAAAAPDLRATAYAWLAVLSAAQQPAEAERWLAEARRSEPAVADKIWNGR